MSAASIRAAKAATDIVEASKGRPVEAQRSEGESPQHTSGPTVLAPDRVGVDQYLKSTIDLKLAEHAYAAAAAIIRTADDMAEEVLRIV